MKTTRFVISCLIVCLALHTANAEVFPPLGTCDGLLYDNSGPNKTKVGEFSNWAYRANGTTGGQWYIDSALGRVESTDAAGTFTWLNEQAGSDDIRGNASFPAHPVYGSSDYTMELTLTFSEEGFCQGSWIISFDELSWQPYNSSGYWEHSSFTPIPVTEHIHSIEIWEEMYYEDPSANIKYDFELELETDDTVNYVRFLTPNGETFEIPYNTSNWDEATGTWTESKYDPDDNVWWWEYCRGQTDSSHLQDFGNGWYTITIGYKTGGDDQTKVWFNIPLEDTPIPQPTQKPVPTDPCHHDGNIEPSVTLYWEQCVDQNVESIYIELHNESTGEEYEAELPVSATSWKPPVSLANGFWKAELYFDRWYEYVRNADNIPVFVGKSSGVDYEFAVGSPWTVYEVWAGDYDHVGQPQWWEYYHNIDQQSEYTQLGFSDGRTTTFSGNYDYYVIASHQEIFVDAVRGSNGSYCQSQNLHGTGGAEDWNNIYGAPDNLYSTIGTMGGGTFRGFVIIANSGWNAITVITDIPGFSVSGRVTDKQTSLPLDNIRVGCWHEDLEVWTDTETDANGMYELTNLPGGEVHIEAAPQHSNPPRPSYASMGVEIELTEDINDLNFALPPAATLSGKVIDAQTAEPLEDIEVTYWNDAYAVWQNDHSDANGAFSLTSLPPGVAEVTARPEVDSGYARSLPEWASLVYLDEGQEKSDRSIALRKGAPVSGYIVDSNGDPMDGIEFGYEGRYCEGWLDTDANGYYEIRLPLGTYSIGADMDDEGFGSLNEVITITDINQPVNVNDITVYDDTTGGQISGTVNNPGGHPKTGDFVIMAFEAGAVVDPNSWYTVWNVGVTDLEEAGPFAIAALPPDVNYDVYLCVENETPDDIGSVVMRYYVLDVPVGTTGITLNYGSAGSTATGGVENTNGQPVMGAGVLLINSATESFTAEGSTDPNGEYVIYNVPAGAYSVTAIHSKYFNSSTTVQVVDGVAADVNTITMAFSGEKEGADLNGDGIVGMLDVSEFTDQWLQSGSPEADFSQDGTVDFIDWTRLAENWLWQAIWLHD